MGPAPVISYSTLPIGIGGPLSGASLSKGWTGGRSQKKRWGENKTSSLSSFFGCLLHIRFLSGDKNGTGRQVELTVYQVPQLSLEVSSTGVINQPPGRLMMAGRLFRCLVITPRLVSRWNKCVFSFESDVWWNQCMLFMSSCAWWIRYSKRLLVVVWLL